MSSGQRKLLLLGGILGIGVAAWVGEKVFPTVTDQGYAPEQPIPFSHKIHAGEHQIDCRYCHVGVTKSRHATIPSLNVCMNCHTQVKTDSPHIQKLTQHYKEGRPLEWVRVHELPDHVRFTHKPHILAGVACETCHGDVKSMDRVFQAQPLTMGWCLQCHRGQKVPPELQARFEALKKFPAGSVEHPGPEGSLAPFHCYVCHY